MSKKQEFINYVEELIAAAPSVTANEDASTYWNAFRGTDEAGEKPLFTDNGKLIMEFLQSHADVASWKAKDIAEELLISSRAVSGATRKLVTDGYVEKLGEKPVLYALTNKGKEITI